MKTQMGGRLSAAAFVVLALGSFAGVQGQSQKPGEIRATEAQLDTWMKELSNWGRWGKDDQLGAVNTITPEKRKQAASLVRTGETVSLAHDIDTAMQQASEFQQPYVRKMGIFPSDRSQETRAPSTRMEVRSPTSMPSVTWRTRAGSTTTRRTRPLRLTAA